MNAFDAQRSRVGVSVFAGLFAMLTATGFAEEKPVAIIAAGAGGEKEYAEVFAKWAGKWDAACAAGGVRAVRVEEREKLGAAIKEAATDGGEPLWLVLLGHGSFDGKEAKFNLPGDDLAVSELAEWLKPMKRPVVVVCGFSASGAFLKPLAAPGRVIVTATKSGAESNYARFGGYFSEAIGNADADLDKDGQTSVLEAWLAAAQRTAEFYANDGRIATEHSLLEDNHDGLGTPPDWFNGVRVVKKSKDAREADGMRAHQIHLVPSAAERMLPPTLREQRDALELELARLREAKGTMSEDDYYAKLEVVLRRIARVYRGGQAGGKR